MTQIITLFAVSAFVLFGTVAQAEPRNQYDEVFLDCIDYGHPPLDQDEIKKCRKFARETVLVSEAIQEIYLRCIEHDRSKVTPEKDLQCLRSASRYYD